jgi:hypothetical protein
MKKIKRAGVANLGAEEVARLELEVKNRARTRAEAELLFDESNRSRESDLRHLATLFQQTPVAEKPSRIAPTIPKPPPPDVNGPVCGGMAKSASVTANVDAFFDKLAAANLTDAQVRYPELLKAGSAPGGRGTYVLPTLSKRTVTPARGTPPAQSSLSGGAA